MHTDHVGNDRPTFGVKTSQANTTWDDVLRIWLEADTVPVFEHAWLWDHMVPLRGDVRGPALEAWTLLAALAARTERLRLGVIVTSNRLRPPAVLAKMAATVDQISRGRLVFGIGAGGSAGSDPAGLALVRREYDAYGIDVVPTREAVGALGEACAILRRMWAEDEPFDFEGEHYRLRGAICEPKPIQRPGPPVMIAAAGPRSLRTVAEHADIWMCGTRGDVGEFRRTSALLDEQCAAVGRDPATIVRSVQLLVGPGDAATGAQGGLPPIAGPAETRERLLAFIDAGARQLVLAPVTHGLDRPVRWLADQVVEPVLGQLGGAGVRFD